MTTKCYRFGCQNPVTGTIDDIKSLMFKEPVCEEHDPKNAPSIASLKIYQVETKSGYKPFSFYKPSEYDQKEYGDKILGEMTLWQFLYKAREDKDITKEELISVFQELASTGAFGKIISNNAHETKFSTLTFEAKHLLSDQKKIITIGRSDSMCLSATKRTKNFTCVHDKRSEKNIMVRTYGRKGHQYKEIGE